MKTLTGIYVNQDKALEWQLNFECAAIYNLLDNIKFWGDMIYFEDTKEYWHLLDVQGIILDLPILSLTTASIFDCLDHMELEGLLEYSEVEGQSAVLLNQDKLDEWQS